MNRNWLIGVMVGCLLSGIGQAKAARQELDLSGMGWKVWLDEKAEWKKDPFYWPSEVNLEKLPVNPPTDGWGTLDKVGKPAVLPGCIEEYYSGGINTWKYDGVSWFWRDMDVPADWKGKVVRVLVEKARLRCELFINGKLAAYDIVAETPFECDASKFLEYGQKNRIAFRLTSIGGNRGWGGGGLWLPRNPSIKYPSPHAFSGVGHVKLTATEAVYVQDVFVKNLLPAGARNVEAQVTIVNRAGTTVTRGVRIEVADTGKTVLATREVAAELKPGENVVKVPFSVPQAKLWDIGTPNLHDCVVSLVDNGKPSDGCTQRFGFRTFEVKKGEYGGHNYYLNGKRFWLQSAIDWGFYAHSGFYATPDAARRSVEAAKSLGQNAISFHRQIGEPEVMKCADELGLYLTEEPGGWDKELEKCRRMFIRDRNHPSLLLYCLYNESNGWGPDREQIFMLFRDLDNTRMIVNTSGSENGPLFTPHIRPYEKEIRIDYIDFHTANNRGARFNETDLSGYGMDRYISRHFWTFPDTVNYLGEVISTTGPCNWVKIARQLPKDRPAGYTGYDMNIATENNAKLTKAFKDWNMDQAGSRIITSPELISEQAARGMLYMMGRHAQTILANETADGYAINGWSSGPQNGDGDWDSAMCDEARNLKGPAEDFRYWIRPAQIAITRTAGKYFQPGEKARFDVYLINGGVIPAGEYRLELTARDGAGRLTGWKWERPLKVLGGDAYAQCIQVDRPLRGSEGPGVELPLQADWHAGFITVEGRLYQGDKVVADGKEQVLLRNRPTWKADLAGLKGAVLGWPGAEKALAEAGSSVRPMADVKGSVGFIAAGALPDEKQLEGLLRRVKEDGTLLVVKFDPAWAELLHRAGVLSGPVKEWGGKQTKEWLGNGWGYLDHFVGDQVVPGKAILGTCGWEVPSDPVGFYPFSSKHRLTTYGVYVARPWTASGPPGKDDALPTLLVLCGCIEYGKGRILLTPGYPIDEEQAFNDLLFFNMLRMGCAGQW